MDHSITNRDLVIVPSRLPDRVRFSNSSNSYLVCARGVARSIQSLARLSDVVNGGGDIGLLPNWMNQNH